MSLFPHWCLSPDPATTSIGSSSHIGVPHICLSITKTCLPPFSQPSLSETDPPPLYLPRYAYQITVAATALLLQEYFSTWPPVVAPQHIYATTAHATSLLSNIPSPLHRPQILAKGPPTSLPSLASCQYIPAAV